MLLDEHWMAEHPNISAPRSTMVRKEAWNRRAIFVVALIIIILRGFLTRMVLRVVDGLRSSRAIYGKG